MNVWDKEREWQDRLANRIEGVSEYDEVAEKASCQADGSEPKLICGCDYGYSSKPRMFSSWRECIVYLSVLCVVSVSLICMALWAVGKLTWGR